MIITNVLPKFQCDTFISSTALPDLVDDASDGTG
eukprot:CAMPEP_0185263276 /NCGR_PEP_ID=MMETSP1359-20130426/13338_1 /TAXON_ID=552665 /ORGANISM="Bigelowiella longifila, Strain CCMP242" /LENGTH=33 /DNA_ID= /DNA_START= /DNA_END= /DNA_ORIENTATION=